MALVEINNGVHSNELIGGTAVSALTANVTLTAASTDTIEAGTLLAGADGAYTVCESGGTAAVILAHAVTPEEAGDITVTVYTRGQFNAEKLVAADGDTVTAHADELRSVGIYLTGIKGLDVESDDTESESDETTSETTSDETTTE